MLKICPLCGKSKRLVRSHIIPEFVLKPTFDATGRAAAIPTSGKPARLVQQAFMHELLCEDCEQFLNREFEQPFHDVWYTRGTVPTIARGPVYNLQLPSYARFKLFFLTVLWRAHACDQGAFKNVEIGEHAPVLQQMILEKRAGGADDYPLLGTVMRIPGTLHVPPIVVSPFPGTWEESTAYMFGFGGVLWFVLLRSGDWKSDVKDWALMEDGRMSLPVVEMSDLGNVHRPFSDYVALSQQRGWRDPWQRR